PLLYAPVLDLADVDGAGRIDGDVVREVQLAGNAAVGAENALNLAIQIQLDDAVIEAVAHIDGVVRGRVRKSPGLTNVGPLAQKFSVGVENLHARIRAVRDVNVPARIERHIVHQVKFAVAGAFVAPLGYVFTIAVELHDAGIHVAVRDVEEIERRREDDAGRLIERILGFVIARAAADHHQHPAFRTELQHEMIRYVDAPDVALGIDADAVRALDQAVVAPALDEIAVAIEFDDRMRAAVEYPDVVLLVDRHAGGFAQIPAFRQLGPV